MAVIHMSTFIKLYTLIHSLCQLLPSLKNIYIYFSQKEIESIITVALK